ncbi:hypothetical protein [Brucella tritici]|uniref:Apea-like HEPN domain-containing protein n=1 Tax=Brucella tritici TaxID=94626 RepID=A0A6L3YBS8_9HYPH|nr:hypothetical protein [Brucella tritici]KAB2681418.1 hypothetical protein F9L08_19240 [Brucella tritici]
MLKQNVPADLQLPEKAGQLFFAQRITELTYFYTKESYRVSTTTVPFLAQECLMVLEDHRTFDLHISGVERVFDELKRRSFQNPVVNELIRVPLDNYFEIDHQNLTQIEDVVRVLASEVTPLSYAQKIATLIVQAGSEEKSKLNFLAGELACSLINLGVSQEHIYREACTIFFSENLPSSGDRLATFLQAVQVDGNNISTFAALIPISSGIGDVNKDVLRLFRAECITDIPVDFEAPEEFVIENAGKSFLYVKNVKATDCFSAAKLIKRNIVRLHDLHGLFHHKGSSNIGKHLLIAKMNEPKSSSLVLSDQNLMTFISDNPRTLAARKLEAMVKTLRLPYGEDSEKFFRIVDFHGMSLNSAIPDNQLINLWTSLETIAPGVKGKSIVGSVCDGVLPFLGLQYIGRIFLQVARDIKRWNNKKFKETLEHIQIDEGIVHKTFLLIVDPTNEALCTSLLSEMTDFPLLQFRISELNKRFKNGKKAEREVRLHLVKAEQQLHRIYRARNSIVHSAEKDHHFTENLIISAHEYFDQVFGLTVELSSTPLCFDNYRDVFSFSKMAFHSYMKGLNKLGDVAVTEAAKFIWRPD